MLTVVSGVDSGFLWVYGHPLAALAQTVATFIVAYGIVYSVKQVNYYRKKIASVSKGKSS